MKIIDYSWGSITLNNGQSYGDCKIIDETVVDWDWKTDGTCHKNGITPEAVKFFIDAKCRFLIVSNGMRSMVKTHHSLFQHLIDNNISYVELPSDEAIHHYQSLISTDGVGLLLHTTC